MHGQGSHSLDYKKNSRNFLGPPETFFHDSVVAQRCLRYRQTAVTYSVYTVWQYSPLQNVHTSCKETVQLAHSRNTPCIYLHTVFYTWMACWLSWTTDKFQDFPRPNSFSRTFQVMEIVGKNPGLFRRCGNPGGLARDHHTWCYDCGQIVHACGKGKVPVFSFSVEAGPHLPTLEG